MAGSSKKQAVLWFRKGLRLHDNPSLLSAAEGAEHLYPIFILDPFFLKPERVGVNRLKFLLESLQDLDSSLRARGSRLLVLKGNPADVFPKILKEWNVSHLDYEYDTEPYAKARDASITKLVEEKGVQVHAHVSHTLYDPRELVKQNGGKPPLTMKGFEKLVDAVGNPADPARDPPAHLPAPCPDVAMCSEEECAVPCLGDIGYPDTASSHFKGGESAALARMADYLSDKKWVAAFEKPKGNPALFVRPATTVLSPYLKFGCLSARLFHAKLLQIYKEQKNFTKPPVSLRGQLLWREFFYCCGAYIQNFDRMADNPICKQVGWVDNEEFLRAWEESRTGYPWIDAIMSQLRTEGWMHHLARHSVACFLTRGDLYCSWEKGRDVFDKYLLDADWSINNANWMWLSASAFFSQYFRVYSPVSFGKQYDKEGAYIRHFLPVLKDMPARYIYEPWTAPLSVQQAAKCVIGKDYPAPIVEHSIAMKENMARMKQAYEASKGAPDGRAAPEKPAAKKARKEKRA